MSVPAAGNVCFVLFFLAVTVGLMWANRKR
jgi:hypothetical protein